MIVDNYFNNLAEWDDAMPFPTIDYGRYARLGLCIGLGLVILLLIHRHFIATTSIFFITTLDIELSS